MIILIMTVMTLMMMMMMMMMMVIMIMIMMMMVVMMMVMVMMMMMMMIMMMMMVMMMVMMMMMMMMMRMMMMIMMRMSVRLPRWRPLSFHKINQINLVLNTVAVSLFYAWAILLYLGLVGHKLNVTRYDNWAFCQNFRKFVGSWVKSIEALIRDDILFFYVVIWFRLIHIPIFLFFVPHSL